MNRHSLLERFCRYARIDSMAIEGAITYPSSPGQLEIGRMLASELRDLGLADAKQDEYGIVLATLPATVAHSAPTIAWMAHVDTSPETTAKNVRPVVHRGYAGGDIVLPGDPSKVIRVADNPELELLKGCTIVTTDGTTLLGSDDKSGVAVIVETAAYLMANKQIPHGPIRICFTCDEEIGHGVEHATPEKIGAVAAYTLDGGGAGEIDVETFSADLAVVRIQGVNIHPSIGKGRMVNAVRIASRFVERLPWQRLSPETTCDRDGFLHPYRIEGGVGEVTLRVLLRDFDTAKLAAHADIVRQTASQICQEFPQASIEITINPQYRNMADGLSREPRAVELAEKAMVQAGIRPKRTIIRGGTDGSRLTEMGLPTPNLSTGEHNLHSPLEWTCVEEMLTACKVLVELARLWGGERA